MKSLVKFHDVRFANSVRMVFINIREDFKPIVACLNQIVDDCTGRGTAEREKAAEAAQILCSILNKKFCLTLSGDADIYDSFGLLVNLLQTVDLLPYERFNRFKEVLKRMSDMGKTLSDHSLCGTKCFWPRYHVDSKSLSDENMFLEVEIVSDSATKGYRTRFMANEEEVDSVRSCYQFVQENLYGLVMKLEDDLSSEVFDEKAKDIIEATRTITDLESVVAALQKDGPIVLGHARATSYLKSVRKILTTEISDIEIKENYKKFIKILNKHVSTLPKKLTSRELIKNLINSKLRLFDGVELTVYVICVAAVKISVESVVESLMSRFERHFNKSRNLDEENAMMEMEVAENGPTLARADEVLKVAMD